MAGIFLPPYPSQGPADDSSETTKADEPQCTIQTDEGAKTDYAQQPYRYHTYQIPKMYTDWICDVGWPETDSERDPDETGSNPSLFDKWVSEKEECRSNTSDDEMDSSETEDDEEDRPLNESEMNEMGLLAIERAWDFPGLPLVKRIIEGLTGFALLSTAVRAIEDFEGQTRSDEETYSICKTMAVLSEALGLNHTGQGDRYRSMNYYTAFDSALRRFMQGKEARLREIIRDTLVSAPASHRLHILGSSFSSLSSAEKSELMAEALGQLHSPPSCRLNSLPMDEDLEKC